MGAAQKIIEEILRAGSYNSSGMGLAWGVRTLIQALPLTWRDAVSRDKLFRLCPRAVLTKYHKLRGLKQLRFILFCSLASSTMWGHSEKAPATDQERDCAGALSLDFPASKIEK